MQSCSAPGSGLSHVRLLNVYLPSLLLESQSAASQSPVSSRRLRRLRRVPLITKTIS